jgi:sialate O-acetylesterase
MTRNLISPIASVKLFRVAAFFYMSMLVVMITSGQLAAQQLSFAPIFNDGAILQCELPVNIWGNARPGSTVDVFLNGQKVSTTNTGDAGRWMAVIPSCEAGGPYVLTIKSGRRQYSVSDVYFGEVWLATGQSNMVQPLRNAEGGPERLQKTIKDIRFVKVPQKTGLPARYEMTVEDLAWHTFAPPQNTEIAAVALFFAEQIQEATEHKVGIIQSSYGGTPAQAWTPLVALDAHQELSHYADQVRSGLSGSRSKDDFLGEIERVNAYNAAFREWRVHREGPPPENPGTLSSENPYSQRAPTVLYENMIRPLIPYTARGVIWYQGEGNSTRPDEYRVLFPAMINAWRKAWENPEWPFLFVQLAAYHHPSADWPGLRAAQAYTRDVMPHTGMALAIDAGEKEDIHPRYKQPVGERLARLALSQVYGQQISCRGPHIKQAVVKNDQVVADFSYTAQGLQTSNGNSIVTGFELAGSDGEFHPANARISSQTAVVVTCDKVNNPVSIRYAWANWVEPEVNLMNSEGLPAEPFNVHLKK